MNLHHDKEAFAKLIIGVANVVVFINKADG